MENVDLSGIVPGGQPNAAASSDSSVADYFWSRIAECLSESDTTGALFWAMRAGAAHGNDLVDLLRDKIIAHEVIGEADDDADPYHDIGALDGHEIATRQLPRILTMADLEALPPPTWLIDDVIPDRGLGVLVGAPGSGKSLFALAVVNSVARQEPLFGLKDVRRSGWVLVLLAESIASWGARSAAYNDMHGLDTTDNFAAIIDGVDFSAPKAIAELSLVVKQEINRRGSYPALIVLDTVSAAIPGVDENNQAAVTPLLAELGRWVRCGIPVIAIHHPSKGGAAYRGSSAFLGNVDWMIGIEVHDGRREIVRHKMRDLEWETPVAFEVAKHGQSIVAVPCAGATPAFMAFSEVGLMDALRDHAYYLPGKDTRRAVRGLDIARGITISDLLTTWCDTAPIRPTSAEDREGYRKEHLRRKRTLIKMVNSMVDDGKLECEKRLTVKDCTLPFRQRPNAPVITPDTTYPARDD